MKKIALLLVTAFILSAFCGCSKDKSNDVSEYTFSGSDECFAVSGGFIELGGEEEIFSGGELTVLDFDELSDITSWSTEFYILADGEKHIVQKNEVVDVDGGAIVEIEGDLGKISGPDIINDDDFEDNLYFVFTGTHSDGNQFSYEFRMDVTKVK